MEAFLTVIASLGLVGSVSLVVWGMALSLRHGFGIDAAGPEHTA
jgi:hypothetical protein